MFIGPLFNFDNVFVFLTGAFWAGKWELKSSYFIVKSDTSLRTARIGDVAGIFLLFKNLLMTESTNTFLELHWC